VGSSGIPEWSLPAPSNLTATAVSFSQIDLSWIGSLGADGYELERSTNGITYSLLATVGPNTTSYSDMGLSQSTTYYYRVRAMNTIGDRSGWSNVVSATTSTIPLPSTWSAVAGGGCGYHTLALSSNGAVWSWGYNNYGQLGLGDTTYSDRTTPSLIEFDIGWGVFEDIAAVSAGGYYSIALKTNGTLWSWGANGSGQLGLGDTETSDAPTPIGTDSDWSQVAAEYGHTLGVKSNNTLWAWGYNNYGQLGLGDTGINRTTPTQIGTASDWAQVNAGNTHTLGVKTSGTLWAWGNNWASQLGDGTTDNRTTPRQVGTDSDWAQTVAGICHALGLKTNRTLWAWGFNGSGQLGDGTQTQRTTPRQITTDSDWAQVSAGEYHTLGVKTSGTLWAWGNNTFGQLGDGTTNNRNIPMNVGTDSDWSQVAAGWNHILGRKSNNTLWVWGNNEYGQLGLGDTIDRNIPTLVGE